MKGRSVRAVLVLAIAGFITNVSPADASNGSLPNGALLLNRMVATVRASNSFHMHYVWTEISSPTTQEISRRDADVALRQHMFHLHLAVQVVTTNGRSKQRFTQTQDVRVAGSHGAERHPGSVWLCTAGYTDQTPPVLVSLHADQVRSIHNLGAATVDGVPVWHVTVDAIRKASAQNIHIVAHEYIARSSYKLVRETLDSRYRQAAGPIVEDRYTVDYSKYSEAVQVRVPACRPP
jgi:hypothetical protein